MIDKFFSVSPSRQSEMNDLKKSYLDDKKELLSKDSHKKDFESYLKEPRGIKKKALEKDTVLQKDKQTAQQNDGKMAGKKERNLEAKGKKEKDKMLHEEVALGIMASIENGTRVSELDDKILNNLNHENLNQSDKTQSFSSVMGMKDLAGLPLDENLKASADSLELQTGDDVVKADSESASVMMDATEQERLGAQLNAKAPLSGMDLKVLSGEQFIDPLATDKLVGQQEARQTLTMDLPLDENLKASAASLGLQTGDDVVRLDRNQTLAMNSLMDEAQADLISVKLAAQSSSEAGLKVLSSEELADQVAAEKLMNQLANDKLAQQTSLSRRVDLATSSSLDAMSLEAINERTQSVTETDFETHVKSLLTQDLKDKKIQGLGEKTEDSLSAPSLKENLGEGLREHGMSATHVSDQSLSAATRSFAVNNTANFVGDASKMSSEQRAMKIEGLQDVFHQAQLLASKGGGEVSLRMNDRAMGDVHLKLALNDGNVQLEILTQSKDVKKMIEDNLSDLKSSLALQQMNVEHVRINSVSESSTENRSQFDSENFFQQNEHTHKNHHESARDGSSGSSQAFKNGDFLNEKPVVSLEEIKKATAKRVYENHKAQTLNAVA